MSVKEYVLVPRQVYDDMVERLQQVCVDTGDTDTEDIKGVDLDTPQVDGSDINCSLTESGTNTEDKLLDANGDGIIIEKCESTKTNCVKSKKSNKTKITNGNVMKRGKKKTTTVKSKVNCLSY